MPVFDITSILSRTEHIYDRDRSKNLANVINWLSANLGEHYGPGKDRDRPNGDTVICVGPGWVGPGWEITQIWKGDPNGYAEVSWHLDIIDDTHATLFALKWAP